MTANFLPSERRTLSLLMAIMALRMLGLFAFVPVASLLVGDFPGASAKSVGLALGIYGLTQAACQIPFGVLSDYFGRKRIMLAGLLFFIIGSAISATASELWVIALGRALQGAGAIGAVLMAMVSDVTRLEVRSKAMAFVGLTMGGSFFIALLLGPLIVNTAGFSGLFWGMTGLGFLSFILCWRALPTIEMEAPLSIIENVREVTFKRGVWMLYLSVMLLHMVLSSLFLVLPSSLKELANLDKHQAWQVYAPALFLSVCVMMPLARRSQNRSKIITIVSAAIACMILSLFLLGEGHTYSALLATLTLFFVGFNLLEALLPVLLSELVARARGSAMGLYGSFQFFGIFLGGALGGWLWDIAGVNGVYKATSVICLLWLGAFMLNRGRLLPIKE